MGKYLVQFVVPTAVLLWVAYWLVKIWYLKRFQRHVDSAKQMHAASKKYDKQINKIGE